MPGGKPYKFKLPIKNNSSTPTLSVVQNDSNELLAQLIDNGRPFDLTGATSATYTALKPDDTIVVGSAAIVNCLDGSVLFKLAPQAVIITGPVEITVEIYFGEDRVTSAIFNYEVTRDIAEGHDPSSTSEWPVLTDLIAEVSSVEAQIESAEAGRALAEDSRDSAEGVRASAELGRILNDNNRNTSESERAAAELIRLEGEIARGAAESIRASNEDTRGSNENTRTTQESTRASNETSRKSAETSRASAEELRASSEVSRVSAENSRALAENGRASAEDDREASELLRVSSEESRETERAAFLADVEYQTPVIVGTQIQIVRNSNVKRLYFKLDAKLSGGAITISLDGGLTSKPLQDFNGVALTTLEKGFVEVVEDVAFFTYRPRGDLKWAPPADWIDIDNVIAGNINLLVAATGLATYAFICTTSAGQYHVDWGDGNSNDYDSDALAEHAYAVGTGQPCSRGYSTFKIVISPVAGDLTRFYIQPHSLATQTQFHGYLWGVCGTTNLTSTANMFFMSSPLLVYCRMLESFKMAGGSLITDASNMFNACSRLQNIELGDLSAVTNASSMFNGCRSLTSIDISGMSAVTNASNMFNVCTALISIVSNLSALTNASSMFASCSCLQNVELGDLSAVTLAPSMFASCYSLESIDISSMVAVTDVSSMFSACLILQNIELGDLSAVTNASSMFINCSSLTSIDISGMSAVTNASNMFNVCYSLKTVSAINFASLAASVNLLTAFSNDEQLTDINMPNAKVTALTAKGAAGKLNKLATLTFHPESTFSGSSPQLDIQYNTLTAAQLDAIFTSLPTVVGKTVNITGCTGAATCTRSIATAKGWTITG
jgi:hypothetical protein